MTPVRLAIVGLGKIARDQHLPALRADGRFTLAAVVDPQIGVADAPQFDTFDALLASPVGFDAVAICTPPQPRHGLARAALSAGKHVLLEKPPGATVGEVEALVQQARAEGLSLFAAWHSRYAAGVEPARRWLKQRTVQAVRIAWREDVRVWHPGQAWIWVPGGFGVMDPGINALSILTRILEHPLALTEATLAIPANCHAPIQAALQFAGADGAPINAVFDFLQVGPQTWDIEVDTSDGILKLSEGGAELSIDGELQTRSPVAEYAGVYEAFANLIADRRVDVDLTPLRHVADAFMSGRRVVVPAFVE